MSTIVKDFPADVKHGTFFERNVPINSMFVHYRTLEHGYARPLNTRRKNKLVSEWDAQAVGILLLSLRNNGLFAVIDGQHRMEAASTLGLKALDAYVYIDLSLQDEARLYRKFGDYLRQTARDRYIAALAEGQPEIVAINRILATRGLHVTPGGGQVQNGVQAIESVLYVAQKFGPTILRSTIDLIHDAFGGEPRAYVGNSIKGTAHFLARFRESASFKRARLIDRMRRIGLDGVEQKGMHVYALDKGDHGTAWGKGLLAIHDSGLQPENKLGEWPARVYDEQTLNAMRLTLSKTNKVKAARDAAAGKTGSAHKKKYRALAIRATCPTCHRQAGRPCASGLDNSDMRGVHPQREIAASALRREKAS